MPTFSLSKFLLGLIALCLLLGGSAKAQTLPFDDTFNRAVTTAGSAGSTTDIGNGWIDINGGWLISPTGTATGGSSVNGNILLQSTDILNGKIAATILSTSSAYHVVLARSKTDQTLMYYAKYSTGANTLGVGYCDHGAVTELKNTAYTGVAGTQYVLTISVTGSSPTTLAATLETTTGTVLAHVGRTDLGDTAITDTLGPQVAGRFGLTTDVARASFNEAKITGASVASATSYTLTPASAAGNVGAAQTYTLTPVGGGYTGTISLSSTGAAGTLSPSSLTFSSSASAQTFTFTPSAIGTATINAAASPALGTNQSAALTVSAAQPTFTASNTALLYTGGLWVDAEYNGHFARMPMGIGSQVNFRATGTGATALLYMPSSVTVQVKVDTGAWTTLTGNASAWASYTLFSGLADTQHDVGLRLTSGSVYQFAIDENAAIGVSGSSPALAAANPALWGPQWYVNSSALGINGKYGQAEGVWTQTADTSNGYARIGGLQTNSSIGSALRFKAQCGSIKFFGPTGNLSSLSLMLTIDGVDQSTLITPTTDDAATGAYGWYTVKTGLDTSAPHEYIVQALNGDAAQWTVVAAMFPGTGLLTAPLTPRSAIAFYGDSITHGSLATKFNTCFAYLLGHGKNCAIYDYGYVGYQVMSDTGSFNALSTMMGSLISLPVAPQALVYLGGINDQVAGNPAADFITADRRTIDTLSRSLPLTKVYVLGITPNNGANLANRTTMNTGKSSNCTSLGYSNLQYVSTNGWISGTNTTTDMGDGLHPNDTGHAQIAASLSSVVTIVSTGGSTILIPSGGQIKRGR